MQTFDEILKKKLLDTFRYTIDFLEKHSISWFAGGGTCIGAIRHKGMIPWDDDIDIFVPRKDFERLLSLSNEFICERYEIKHQCLDSNYGARFAKVIDRTTTIYPTPIYPFVMGVFVDIFPLDFTDDEEGIILQHINSINKKWSVYFSSFIRYPIKNIINSIWHPMTLFRKIKTNILNYKRRPNKLLRDELLMEDRKFIYSAGRHCFISYGYKDNRDIFDSNWFDEFLLKPFEDFYVRVPVGYDAYLTHVFGDYMTPPPVNKRVYKHPDYYVNLKEGLDLIEIKRRIKLGEKKVF